MEIFYWELWSSQSHWVNQLFQMLPTCIQILLHWFFLSVWRFSAKQQEALKQFHHQSLNLEYCYTTRVCITTVHVLYFYLFVLMHLQNIFLSFLLPCSPSLVQKYEVDFGEKVVVTAGLRRKVELRMLFWNCKNKGKCCHELCRPLFFTVTNLYWDLTAHNLFPVFFVH